jgi:hypothetical protein
MARAGCHVGEQVELPACEIDDPVTDVQGAGKQIDRQSVLGKVRRFRWLRWFANYLWFSSVSVGELSS